MNALERRISKLEQSTRVDAATQHFISVLRYPYGLSENELQAWLRERCRCDCTPECPGKHIGLLLPEAEPSPEAWAEKAQQWYRERSSYQRWDD
jgi:hypothetical protein